MATAKAKTSVDYALQAKSALNAIEKVSDNIEAVEQQVSMCRNKWRDYGEALVEQRSITKSNNDFGRWIKTNGLDKGRAANAGVRSDAMWLAENYSVLHTSVKQKCPHHHPTHIRQWCRDKGYKWAGAKKPRKAKAKKKQYKGWDVIASVFTDQHFAGGGRRDALLRKIHAIDAELKGQTNNPKYEDRLREACYVVQAQTEPEKADNAIEELRGSCTTKQKLTFDQKVQRALKIKTAELQKSYQNTVQAEVTKQVKKERSRVQEQVNHFNNEAKKFEIKHSGIKQALSLEDYRLILNCLHPDRAPVDRKDKFAKAFHAVRKLKKYVEVF